MYWEDSEVGLWAGLAAWMVRTAALTPRLRRNSLIDFLSWLRHEQGGSTDDITVIPQFRDVSTIASARSTATSPLSTFHSSNNQVVGVQSDRSRSHHDARVHQRPVSYPCSTAFKSLRQRHFTAEGDGLRANEGAMQRRRCRRFGVAPPVFQVPFDLDDLWIPKVLG